VGIGGQESEVSTGQYPADHVASYASQHKRGLSIDRSSKAGWYSISFSVLDTAIEGTRYTPYFLLHW
jgi:hypothetical protein